MRDLRSNLAISLRNPAGVYVPPALRTVGIILGGSLLAAVCSHIVLPLYFTPVPLSLQPFAVLILGLLLGPRMATATMAAYLAEGAMGLPVFAPGMDLVGGLAHLLGPTGGYLLAYPLAAGLVSYLWRRTRRGFAWAFMAAAAGDLLILVFGALWLTVFTHASAPATFAMAVLPFLPGDVLKVAAAAGVAVGYLRMRHSNA